LAVLVDHSTEGCRASEKVGNPLIYSTYYERIVAAGHDLGETIKKIYASNGNLKNIVLFLTFKQQETRKNHVRGLEESEFFIISS